MPRLNKSAPKKAWSVPHAPGSDAMTVQSANSADKVLGFTEKSLGHLSRPAHLSDLHGQGIDGRGVTVAVIDSGVVAHEDFGDRIKAFKDFGSRRRKPFDYRGHGTHVAGVILGDGKTVDGIAPKADLVACRVSSNLEVIKALDWVVENKEKYSIDVLNLSLGVDTSDPDSALFVAAAERAVDAGIVVVVSSGNDCQGAVCRSTISSPGNSPKVITVGALDDRGTTLLGDDTVWSKSSQGGKGLSKPDLIAEGADVVSVLAPGSRYAERVANESLYFALSGSSLAAPMVAGAAALMLQVNPNLTHQQIKDIVRETADPLKGASRFAQGSGRLDLDQAVERAVAFAKTAKKAS